MLRVPTKRSWGTVTGLSGSPAGRRRRWGHTAVPPLPGYDEHYSPGYGSRFRWGEDATLGGDCGPGGQGAAAVQQ